MADAFLSALKRHVAQFDNQYQAAESLEITASYLSLLLSGKRDPSERMLKALGLKRTITKLSPAERDKSAVA